MSTGAPIVPAGTQIVSIASVDVPESATTLPVGAVGAVIGAPADSALPYRIRFVDGSEASLRRHEFRILKAVRESGIGEDAEVDWTKFVIFRCVVGSHAYGLESDESDVDRRGIYLLPPADLQCRLRAIRRGEMPWEEIDAWRLALHRELDDAFTGIQLGVSC